VLNYALLLSDITDIKSQLNLPHIPDRREVDGRATRVMDGYVIENI